MMPKSLCFRVFLNKYAHNYLSNKYLVRGTGVEPVLQGPKPCRLPLTPSNKSVLFEGLDSDQRLRTSEDRVLPTELPSNKTLFYIFGGAVGARTLKTLYEGLHVFQTCRFTIHARRQLEESIRIERILLFQVNGGSNSAQPTISADFPI
jgi:hypothetical protein